MAASTSSSAASATTCSSANQMKSSTHAFYFVSIACPTETLSRKQRLARVGSPPAFAIALARPRADCCRRRFSFRLVAIVRGSCVRLDRSEMLASLGIQGTVTAKSRARQRPASFPEGTQRFQSNYRTLARISTPPVSALLSKSILFSSRRRRRPSSPQGRAPHAGRTRRFSVLGY